MADILVYVLHRDGAFNQNSLGALSEASVRAAELGGEAHALVLGDRAELSDEVVSDLGRYGTSRVFRAQGPVGLAQPVVDALDQVISEHHQRYVLFGGGLLGFEAGAGLAARRRAGVTMEVTAVRVRDGELVAERPILGDSKISVSRYRSDPGIIIGRLNAFDARDRGSGAAEIVDVDVDYSPWSLRAELVTRGESRGEDVDIEAAEVLVAGGRGLGQPEGFALAEELAAAFGERGAVAATRAVVDLGWYPYSAQVGQTGKTVAPKLYVAAGISGAVQHKVGMQGSEHILAINKDRNAPIFAFADLGIVGDLNKILPRLSEAIRARKAA